MRCQGWIPLPNHKSEQHNSCSEPYPSQQSLLACVGEKIHERPRHGASGTTFWSSCVQCRAMMRQITYRSKTVIASRRVRRLPKRMTTPREMVNTDSLEPMRLGNRFAGQWTYSRVVSSNPGLEAMIYQKRPKNAHPYWRRTKAKKNFTGLGLNGGVFVRTKQDTIVHNFFRRNHYKTGAIPGRMM
jgi:hypothetical protein